MTLSFEDLLTEYESIINSVAQQFGAKGHRWGADHDDFHQELSLWIYSHFSKVAAKQRDLGPSFDGWFAKALRNAAKDVLAKVAAQSGGGRDATDEYWYTTGELKVLLPSIFDPGAKLHPPKFNGEDRAKRDPAHGNNWLVTLADVEVGYNKLSLEDQNLLALFHRDGWRNKDLASAWDLTEAQMSWRHTRAIERLLHHLGGPKPKPQEPADPFKGRRAVSNAQARAMTSAAYEED